MNAAKNLISINLLFLVGVVKNIENEETDKSKTDFENV